VALTEKQKRFANEYVVSLNATQAAIKAGYSVKTARQIGTENLAKPDISNFIKKQLDKISSDKIADQTEVMEFLTETMRGEVMETVTSAGEVFKVPTSTKDRIKSAELIGKRHAMWTDKVDMASTNINIEIGSDYDG